MCTHIGRQKLFGKKIPVNLKPHSHVHKKSLKHTLTHIQKKSPKHTHTHTHRRKITVSETQNHSNTHTHTHTTTKTYQITNRSKVG